MPGRRERSQRSALDLRLRELRLVDGGRLLELCDLHLGFGVRELRPSLRHVGEVARVLPITMVIEGTLGARVLRWPCGPPPGRSEPRARLPRAGKRRAR